MPLTLLQLRTFLTVAQHGTFTRAAAALYVSQSAVSQQIEGLEREQGVRLFDRLPRRVVLTDAGHALLPYAERILVLADDAEHALAEVRGVVRGRLRLGASQTPATYVLPAILGAFAQAHPGIEVVLEVEVSGRIADRVAAGELALGIVEGYQPDPQLLATTLLADELVLAAPPDMAAADGVVRPAALADRRYLAREPGALTRQFVEAQLRELGVMLHPALELGHIEALRRAVAAGLGVAFLSRLALAEDLATGRVQALRVAGLDLHRPWYLLQRQAARLSPAAATFAAYLHERLGMVWPPATGPGRGRNTP